MGKITKKELQEIKDKKQKALKNNKIIRKDDKASDT